MSEDTAIWEVPLLILAGLFGLAGVAVGIAVWRGSLPEPWGPALQWGLAGASLTFTIARIVHARSVSRRELELIVLAAAVVFAHYMTIVAGAIVVGAVIALILDEL